MIFMPETGARNKIRALEAMEARLRLVGRSYAEAHEAMLASAASTGACEAHAISMPMRIPGWCV
ncbi:hypothetical protein [Thermoflexus sp.]|uniref:hypothetical protein n=1 Tax=Thermoflexus sp. TaxID=1969742 RepID=UPI002ADD5FEC|nr:hypothetical protein [Thermoflexus sp.]